ncbi:uncharacterized protein LOC126685742 [Mercurialis annua]|uniref:uncharacterized protein LOC126685742 n=1 Tax=Mercurialis annua TaxID=3986 RepID=UPI002160F7EC|nr:uncharacterized protein LOC126685742 [Mercurialis annua]
MEVRELRRRVKADKSCATEEPRTFVLKSTKQKDSPLSSEEEGRECRTRKMIKIEDLAEKDPPTLKTQLARRNAAAEATVTEQAAQENDKHSDPLSALSGPPDSSGVATDMLQCNELAVSGVKKGLALFLMTKSNNDDAGQMIDQANNAFLYLKGVNADYRSFYAIVRSFILNCWKFQKAEKEVQENSQSVKIIIDDYETLDHQSSKAKKAFAKIEVNLVKAKSYMAPLEARVQDTRELLEKLEVELCERRTEIEMLEADKARVLEEKDAADIQIREGGVRVKEAQSTLRDMLFRQERLEQNWERVEDS